MEVTVLCVCACVITLNMRANDAIWRGCAFPFQKESDPHVQGCTMCVCVCVWKDLGCVRLMVWRSQSLYQTNRAARHLQSLFLAYVSLAFDADIHLNCVPYNSCDFHYSLAGAKSLSMTNWKEFLETFRTLNVTLNCYLTNLNWLDFYLRSLKLNKGQKEETERHELRHSAPN